MSQWTHVAGIVRVDALPFGDPTKTIESSFGKTCEYDSPESARESCTVPCGSEGSVQYCVEHTGGEHSLAWGCVYIWGDLRDYSDAQEIYKWLKTATKSLLIRSCVVKIDIEYQKSYIVCDVPDDDGLPDGLIMNEIKGDGIEKVTP